MSKRRLISQLPAVNQTADLTNFCGATVDQVFQPGTSEALSGYIGHTVGNSGFYIGEPTAARAFYQLEPGMTSYDPSVKTQVDYALTYPDLVSYLAVNGANTSDEQRLFETDYYGWAPPINIDMLVNYRNYYWFGDVGSSDNLYAFSPYDRNPTIVLIGSNLTAFAQATAPQTVRSNSIPAGSWYVEFGNIAGIASGGLQYCGLANSVDDIMGLPGTMTGGNAVFLSSDGYVFTDGVIAPYPINTGFSDGDTVAMAWSTSTSEVWFRVNDGPWNKAPANPANGTGGIDITTLQVNGAPRVMWAAANGNCSVTVNFGALPFECPLPSGFTGPALTLLSTELPTLTLSVPYSIYHGDGITTQFALPHSILSVNGVNEQPSAYVNNVAVPATISGANLTLSTPPAAGSTIIVCRVPNYAQAISGISTAVDISDLNTKGVTYLTSSMRIQIVDATSLLSGWDGQPWDDTNWDAGNNGIYMVDGVGQSIRLTPDSQMIRGLGAQYVTVDRSSYDASTAAWAQRNAWVHGDSFAWANQDFSSRRATQPIIEFVRDLKGYEASPNIPQVWNESVAPLFMLYDLNNHALDDLGFYPGSTFQGNRLFGYASANTSLASTLVTAPQLYDTNGYVIFNNDAATVPYTFQFGTTNPVTQTITGLRQYALVGNDGWTEASYQAFWHPVATPTTQDLTNGFYEIPLNLRANPDSAEIGQISRSTWNAHFASILSNQNGFSGNPDGDNNYRDTARDLTLGTAIVQHHAPLLKTMLLASDTKFDVLDAARYVELEYTRFKNKFVRKLVDLTNQGTLQPTDSAALWVSAILTALKIGHNGSFPFALSSIGGGQYFIPPTPAALGMLPTTVPTMITDTTYDPPINMLVGHDGSLTPAFNDWRDDVVLALETQIYDNLRVPVGEARPPFDIQQWLGTCFYTPTNGYTWSETTAILSPMFELWAQANSLDYRTHQVYDPGNPFTWNYRGIVDQFGNTLPGYWRGIYRLYYDTDAPHTRPWEMLGFVGEPAWWQSEYGATPYLRSNAMWADLEAGLIRGGPRTGTDVRYARPGLRNFIPVDDNGVLLDPVAIGIVRQNVTYEQGIRDWLPGDGAPIEAQWLRSSAFRFALIRAAFLMKPPRLVEQCWDALKIGYVDQQWVELETLQRPFNAQQYVHGEVNPDAVINPSGKPMEVVGISQWIADYMLSKGQTSAVLGTAVRGLDVNLMHLMAGFVVGDTVELVADSFGLLPSEDVQTVLYTSPAISTQVYSGVIVQWTGSGWMVIGYDTRNPSFTVIPPNTTGPKGLISLAGASEPAIVPWRSGTYYPVQILVSYQHSVYQCATSHTSTSIFEQNYWTPRPDLSTNMIMAPRVVTYGSGLATTQQVPYGTVFTTYQAIADFLLGYERWLVASGWSFTNVDPNSGQILNWSLSVYEFLAWTQVQWAPGNFIALSPGQTSLQFTASQGTILNVEDELTGFYGLLNRNGQPISQRNVVVNRLDDQITLAATNNDIFLARLELSTVEHALIVSNTTLFSDVVYLPQFDVRQERLLLNCNRANGWAGRLDAPGFVIVGNTLASSFEKAANDVRYMFDIEKADVKTLRDYARHDLGMQQTAYFDNLLMSPNTQFEFYQGMIRSKGSLGAFSAITRSTVATTPTSSMQFLEEWGIRMGTFGAPRNPFITFQASQNDFRDDPQFVRFVSEAGSPLDWIQLTASDTRWFDQPATPTFFPEQVAYTPSKLPTAGPVRLSEVDSSVMNFTDMPGLYDSNTNPMPTGTRIWVYNGDPSNVGTNWYVNCAIGIGSDSNDGRTAATPFATLQRAHDVSNPGDTINVASGTYVGSALGTPLLSINRSGTVSAPITFKAMPGATPVLQATVVINGLPTGLQSNAVQFNAVSHIVFQDFEIQGFNLFGVSNADCSGIAILPAGNTFPHHITVRNCRVHDFPYNGIFATHADYITVEACKVYDNGLFSGLAGSGITILNSKDVDTVTTYKTFISRNMCWGNVNNVVNATTNTYTDGEGIAIANNMASSTAPAYGGKTLVSNNLCFGNGGAGILVSNSSGVDVTFNTASQNQSKLTTPLGEIVANLSANCNIYNNIMVAPRTAPITTNRNRLAGIVYASNIGYGGNSSNMPGLYSYGDPLFVNATQGYYAPRLGSSAIGAANPAFSTELDLNGNERATAPALDIGCYQTRASIASQQSDRHNFDVFYAFDIGMADFSGKATTNAPVLINTPNEDPTLTGTRLFFQTPFALTSDDVGNYLIIDGQTNTAPNFQGLQLITAVYTSRMSAPNSGTASYFAVDVEAVGTQGTSFLGNLGAAPICRVLRSVRFANFASINPNYLFASGDLVWIDSYTTQKQWAVLQYEGGWVEYRLQPHRIDAHSIAETVIYSSGAKISGQKMVLNQPVVSSLDVIDPTDGLICNLSQREIDFATVYDPANYNAGFTALSASAWGRNEVGRVWWDLSTVRFLDPYTNTLGRSQTADVSELQYRISNMGQVAPNTSVDVYEWTESNVDPLTYINNGSPGQVYNPTEPSWVETTTYNALTQTTKTTYYFWVSGLTVVPDLAFRNISVSTIAQGIVSPSSLGVPWMSAISRDGLLVSGVYSELDDTTTVMKVALSSEPDSAGVNDQWMLMRPGDATSLPTDRLWGLLRDSLAQFAITGTAMQPVPDPTLSAARNTGTFPGQSMFVVSQLTIAPWTSGQTYHYGDQVSNNGYAYVCVLAGVSSALNGASGPTGYSSTISDGTVMWAYHGLDASRQGLMDARKAFVGSVNAILAQTPVLVSRSTAAASIRRYAPFNQFQPQFNDANQTPYLIWSPVDDSYPFELPPANEWDIVVATPQERNRLLATAQFQTASSPISVLINGFANDAGPQWSIWVFNPTLAQQIIAASPTIPATAALMGSADQVFSLKTAYEYLVADETARNQLLANGTLVDGDRVLVLSDTAGFWAIWKYTVLNGFELWRAQTYDTSIFLETANWYDTATLTANGYSAENPPIISYATASERDLVEGPNPTNLFVAIANEGIWTAYIGGVWTTVEMDNATLQLSSAFYDQTRVFYGADDKFALSNIDRRDGSFELRILAHALRYSGLLLDSEINTVWFDMLNFVHTQQNEVDWAFKTSFLNIAGLSVPLSQTPVITVDQTQNVIDYINTVKPYRVKVRESSAQYAPGTVTASVTATDFDCPVYYDPTLKAYRVLDPNNSADVAILQTAPWSEWYAAYQAYTSGMPVGRSFDISLLFDRVSDGSGNWDLYPWDSGNWDDGELDMAAAYRIMNYYYPPGVDPTNYSALLTARVAAIQTLLGLGAKYSTLTTNINFGFDLSPLDTSEFDGSPQSVGVITDGGALDTVAADYSVDINPTQPSRPGGFDLRDPYYAPNHPEERVPFSGDDGLQIIVSASPLPGAPPQIVKVFDVTDLAGTTATLYFGLIVQSAVGVFVSIDGVQQAYGSYTVNYFDCTVTVTVPSGAKRVMIRAIGFGGSSSITEQHFLSYGTEPLTLNATTSVSNLLVVVNASIVPAGTPRSPGYSISGNTVTLSKSYLSGADVALVVFSGGTSTATSVTRQAFSSLSGANVALTLSSPDTQTVPPHAGTIVELNGERLAPPMTFYGSITPDTPWMFLPVQPSTGGGSVISVYVDGVLYTAAIPVCTTTSPASTYPLHLVVPNGETPSTGMAGQFVIFGSFLVALDPTFASDNVVVVMNPSEADYTVSADGSTVTINTTLGITDQVVVTTFTNAGQLDIRTVCYPATTTFCTVPTPLDDNYAMVSMNGLYLAPEADYTIQSTTIAVGPVSFASEMLTLSDIPRNGWLVATVFAGAQARQETTWMYTTKTPSYARMTPQDASQALPDGYDGIPLDTQSFDFAFTNDGPVFFNGSGSVPARTPLYGIHGSFETLALTPYSGGSLVADLGPSDTSFQVNLFTQPIAADLSGINPLPIPDVARLIPGVVWIENERIEYFGYERNGNVATLSTLRRATRGTSMGQQRLFYAGAADGALQTFSFPRLGTVDVTVNGELLAPEANGVANYTVSTANGATTVSLQTVNGNYLNIGLTVAASHLSGVAVWNGYVPRSNVPVNQPPTLPPGPVGTASGEATVIATSAAVSESVGTAAGTSSAT